MSAAQVHRTLEELHWRGYVGIRKVQEVIKSLKERGGGRFERTEWHPWRDRNECPEDSDFLLEIDRVNLEVLNRHIWEHEAEWARRLRVALRGLPRESHWFFAIEYGDREESARNRGVPHATTADLDAWLMFKPWRSEDDNRAWRSALDKSEIPSRPLAPGLASRTVLSGLAQSAAEVGISVQEMERLTAAFPDVDRYIHVVLKGLFYATSPHRQDVKEAPGLGRSQPAQDHSAASEKIDDRSGHNFQDNR